VIRRRSFAFQVNGGTQQEQSRGRFGFVGFMKMYIRGSNDATPGRFCHAAGYFRSRHSTRARAFLRTLRAMRESERQREGLSIVFDGLLLISVLAQDARDVDLSALEIERGKQDRGRDGRVAICDALSLG